MAKSTVISKECANALNDIFDVEFGRSSLENAINDWKIKYQVKPVIGQNKYDLPDKSEIELDESNGNWK